MLNNSQTLRLQHVAAFGMSLVFATLVTLSGVNSPATVFADDNLTPLKAAEQLYLTGKYDEALEAFDKLPDQVAVEAAIGKSRVLCSTGKRTEALKVLTDAAKTNPKQARLLAERAKLNFGSGKYEEAQQLVTAALTVDASQVVARWLQAELHRVKGDLAAAESGYEWFIDYYNSQDTFDRAEQLHYIGLAAAQYARWNRSSDQFSFLVNDLYPEALDVNDKYWPVLVESARLFLEKFNTADAASEAEAALKINPKGADAICIQAMIALEKFKLPQGLKLIDAALEIDPASQLALQTKADLLLVDWRYEEAISLLEKVLEQNPRDEGTLGRLAAAYGAADGYGDTDDSRMQTMIARAIEQNEHCGNFFRTLATTIDRMRKFPYAAKYYEEAERRMPQLVGVRGQLGMLYMRLGEEAKAAKLLNESFDIDPFNVRVKNTLEVLEVLQGYAVLETEHFVIKFDRGQDEIFSQYAAAYLEEVVYPDIVKTLGYEPEGKSLFEFFSRAKNTSGHSWFSARMVGLPSIGTVGACAGRMVAMVSPNDMNKKFNWARVLKHEFVHVVNLQQTNFNIPHWFTEALAVHFERMPRPAEWNRILQSRARADDLFNLSNINMGFVRPKSPDYWTLAYCQSELYADYMLANWGDDAISEMLTAYRDNLSTEKAIQRCFDVSVKDFESGYREYIDEIVASMQHTDAPVAQTLEELQQAAKAMPKDADVQANLALALLQGGKGVDARRHAMAAIKIEKKQQLANYVLAKSYLSDGDEAKAKIVLAKALDEESPHPKLLSLKAATALKSEDFETAERLYKLGIKHFPDNIQWLKALSSLYVKQKKNKLLRPLLEKLAPHQGDDPAIRKKLAQLHLAEGNYQEARKWANQSLQIDVLDAGSHALLADAFSGSEQFDDAVKQYKMALKLRPKHAPWELALAKGYQQLENVAAACETLEELLEHDSDNAEASKLLQSLKDKT